MTTVEMIDTKDIIPGPNDRTVFDAQALKELAANIQEHGLIQPITVRWIDELQCYQIVAGERRFRACTRVLEWAEIPAIVKELDDMQASAIMLAENIARADLDPIDEARAYQSRMDRYSLTVKDIAEQAGVTTVRVKFRLKLLNLRADVQDLVRKESLALGYAQVLADADLDPNFQMLAVSKLRDNPRPTPQWFRTVVYDLLEQQAQAPMFEMPLLGGPQFGDAPQQQMTFPPTPADTTPPVTAKTPRGAIEEQMNFWERAAEAWNALGKPFKRQECEAAARVLQFALTVL